MSEQKFSKGQEVLIFGTWDNKGKISIQKGIVYSAGKKQMVLNSPEGECLGRHYSPYRQEREVIQRMFNWHLVRLADEVEDPETFALEMGALFQGFELERLHRLLDRNLDAAPGYLKALEEHVAEFMVTEPSFFWKD